MNANAENLVLEHLKAIRAGLTRMEEDIRNIKLRLTSLEHGQAHFFTSYAQQQSTLDRLDGSHRILSVDPDATGRSGETGILQAHGPICG